MDKLQNIKVFIEVAKQQSFSDAADTLGLSAPAVTRAIAALENGLKVKLFNRTTRLVRLTDAGTHFLRDVTRIVEELDEAEAAAAGVYSKPTGMLTVTAPVLFGQKHIMPIVTEYLALHPDVSVKAMFFDRVSSLLEEEMDIAIRIGHLKDSSLYAIQVGEVRRIVCGAPDYFARKGLPVCPSELANHDIIFPMTFDNINVWHFQREGKKEPIKIAPRLYCNQNTAALEAAVNGHGITRLVSYQVGEELEKGTLKSVLTGFEEAPLPVHLIHLEGRRANIKVRSFIDLAVERLRTNPFINPQGKF
ncbi:LysR family transcriptional regulator [Marinomonas agarivorans]|nr:LysR family transcriptional regulator [Marinomonas agarivorans]